LLVTAKKEARRSIVVVMGAASPAMREKEARTLLNYGYQKFAIQPLYAKGDVLGKIPVWKGGTNTLAVVATENGSVTLPAAYKNRVHEDRILPASVVAPIIQGQEVGKSVIKLDADIIKSVPLVAQADIPKAGLFKSLSHSLFLLLTGVGGLIGIGLFVVLGVVLAFLGAVLLKTRRGRRTSALRI
jgi:D-alanyl-D-alanine carboxypeptidase (penicillin-binding protein 5/6)